MKEQDVVQSLIDDLLVALPAEFTVQTDGGDGSASPPLCILSWNTVRLPRENGHNSLGRIVYDSNDEAYGRELHRYERMEAEVVIRSYDEAKRDEWLADVKDHFLKYEYNPDPFSTDATEWDVGDGAPRSNPVIEPDWYEATLSVRFKFVARVVQEDATLSAVQENVDGE